MRVMFRRVQPTLGRADECHLPERAVDPSCDQDPRKVVSLLRREITVNHNTGISSHERLWWATEVTGQSEAASQACAEERTRQRASRGGDEFAEGFKSPQIMAQRVVALFLLSDSCFLSSNTTSRDSIH